MDSSQTEVSVCGALATGSRWNILRSISTRSKSVDEISQEVGLAPITVRHHLQVLTQAGLAEEDNARISRKVGRPQFRYRVASSPVNITFPKRNYLYLSDFLINALILKSGEDGTRKFFVEVGRGVGKGVVDEVAMKAGIADWTPQLVQELLVKGTFEEFGAGPELIRVTESEVNFAEHNCIFQELAVKYPNVVCDGLDDGFHAGIDEALGSGVRTEKLRCRGHGDPFCQYAIHWLNK